MEAFFPENVKRGSWDFLGLGPFTVPGKNAPLFPGSRSRHRSRVLPSSHHT
ncbi:unnamed protein product [Ectocarpus sp. CCAP 1310/34]|nr:unnamed protein product [Ectocarpus sp. CCAP 1310/34]